MAEIISNSNIKATCKDRIIGDMIRAVKPDGKNQWKALVLDKESMRIISACCKMYDIMEEGVTVVEMIDMKRQPLPELDAIYFLTPTTASIDTLIADFKKKDAPQYGNVHLFFTSKLPDTEFQKIANSLVAARIKTLKEFNMEFVPYETQSFHFDMKDAMIAFFSPDNNDAPRYQNIVANRMVTLMAALNEYPIIRFSKSHPLSSTIATAIQTKIDALVRTATGWTPNEDRAILLIMDRTMDPISPLLHEFTYQAMIHDVLQVNGDKYAYESETNAGTKAKREMLLDETDVLWPVLRHKHIADVSEFITEKFAEFLKSNKAANYKGNTGDLTQMTAAMRAMPQYTEILAKYSLHINITQDCFGMFNKLNLETIANVEQEMATGEDADGKNVKNVITKLPPILSDPNIPLYDKLRILMLYIISQDGVAEKDRKRLMDLSGVSLKDQSAIANLFYLGVTLQKGAKGRKTKKDVRKKKREGEVPFHLSRFVPNVKDILEDLLNNNLSPSEFPFTKDDPSAGQSQAPPREKPQARMSLKGAGGGKQPTWADKGKKRESAAPALQGSRIVLFIAGGMTYSEMRSAYELTQQFQRPVFIGSTHITTPSQFISDLSKLKSS